MHSDKAMFVERKKKCVPGHIRHYDHILCCFFLNPLIDVYVLSLAPTHLKSGQMGESSNNLYNIIESIAKHSLDHYVKTD